MFKAQSLLNFLRFILIFFCGVVCPVSFMPTGFKCFANLMLLIYTLKVYVILFHLMAFRDVSVLLVFFILFILPAIKMFHKKLELGDMMDG